MSDDTKIFKYLFEFIETIFLLNTSLKLLFLIILELKLIINQIAHSTLSSL